MPAHSPEPDLPPPQPPVQSRLLPHFFDQNPDGILVINLKDSTFIANSAFYELFGLTEKELTEELVRIKKPVKWDAGFPFSIKHVLALPLAEEAEHQILRPGNVKVARLVRTEIKLENGAVGLALWAKDITSQMNNVKDTPVHGLHFETVARHFPNGNITIVDRNLDVVFTDGVDYETDRGIVRLTEGQSLLEQYGPNYAPFIKDSIYEAFSGASEEFELRFGDKTYAFLITPLPDKSGKTDQVMKIVRNVTEERRALLEAHYRREYLRQVIDVDPNLIYVKNKENQVIMANKSVASFFGCSVAEFLENSTELFKTYKWKYEELENLEYQIFNNLKTITSEEALFNRETKKMHLFQVTRTPFATEGNELSILCVGVDITDRVNAENELITQREYLRHILDTDPSFIFVKDHKGKFILVNKAFSEFYKSKPEDLLGKSDAELPWSASDQEIFQNSDRMVMDTNETITLEEHILNPITGSDVYFVTTKKPLMDVDGNLNILGVVTDITAQKIQEQKLRKSELMLQEIFNRVADALLIIDFKTGLIVDCNYQAVNILKSEHKEKLIGRPLYGIQIEDAQNANFWNLFFIEAATTNPTAEVEIKALDRSRFWGSLAMTKFTQEGKELALLRITDITAQKKSEEQIIQALHEKEILIQEIHHRVKNNMAVISSLLQLQTGYIKDPALIDVFKDSQSRIKSMALIHEKLYQSKTLAKLEMDSYIKELTRTLLFTYNARRVDIRINTSVQNVFLDINSAVPCGLIINELISNACKHAFTGRQQGTIDISFTKEGDLFHLVVQDDGVGMPPDTDYTNFKSLGMNLVQALSAQLGAHLEITAAHGLRFSISFTEKSKPNRENVR